MWINTWRTRWRATIIKRSRNPRCCTLKCVSASRSRKRRNKAFRGAGHCSLRPGWQYCRSQQSESRRRYKFSSAYAADGLLPKGPCDATTLPLPIPRRHDTIQFFGPVENYVELARRRTRLALYHTDPVPVGRGSVGVGVESEEVVRPVEQPPGRAERTVGPHGHRHDGVG